jgi:hypothetical protein
MNYIPEDNRKWFRCQQFYPYSLPFYGRPLLQVCIKLIGMQLWIKRTRSNIGIGIVVCDHEGVVLAARSTTMNVMVEPIAVEVMLWICVRNWVLWILYWRETPYKLSMRLKHQARIEVSLDISWMESKSTWASWDFRSLTMSSGMRTQPLIL